ncbi:YchJ family protein [Arcobacter sp. LA11]|uniref:YchJ family protein n=1 Tax=Arcobacter sp. LA11 TaxID=1898176 RepID=UPI0009355B74|nr:YchJ family metal-binding protein [Arcobacter sp. LA11]
MKISVNAMCPCGSLKKFKKCCKIFHNGSNAKTALELMKSRYSAFAAGDFKYIMKTTHKDNPDYSEDKALWKESILTFSKDSDFKELKIIDFIEDETESYVTFNATIFHGAHNNSFCEKSKFIKVDGVWLYHSGEIIDA